MIRIRVYTEQLFLNRKSYSLLNVMSDVGGVCTSLMIVLRALNKPLSKHLFLIDFLKYLFLSKTKYPKLFLYNLGSYYKKQTEYFK